MGLATINSNNWKYMNTWCSRIYFTACQKLWNFIQKSINQSKRNFKIYLRSLLFVKVYLWNYKLVNDRNATLKWQWISNFTASLQRTIQFGWLTVILLPEVVRSVISSPSERVPAERLGTNFKAKQITIILYIYSQL